MIPNASGKLDPDGKPYRYYTCGYAHKERSDANCPVRHVSATALETAVVGFLGACSQHPDVLAATTASVRARRQTDRAPLRARLSEAEKGLAAITDQLRNCAKALVLGHVTALDEVLREQADALQVEKQRLLVGREQVRLELATCEEGDIDTERVRVALNKFWRTPADPLAERAARPGHAVFSSASKSVPPTGPPPNSARASACLSCA